MIKGTFCKEKTMRVMLTQNYNFTIQNKSSIRNISTVSANHAYNKRISLNTNPISNTRVQNNTFYSKINFGKRVQKSDELLESLGYVFHHLELSNISHILAIMEITKVSGTFYKDYEASRASFKKMVSAIKERKEVKRYVLERLSEIEIAKGIELENVTEQQFRVKKHFGDLVGLERKGTDVAKRIPNGIFIHGKSNEKNNNFTSWFIKNTPVLFDKEKHIIKYIPEKPLKTLEEIKAKALEAKDIFNMTKERTLLYVENLDELFTDYSTTEKRQIIARYKAFIEHVSEDFHTTLLMKSEKPVEDFESGTLGGQRFGGLNLPIKSVIAQSELDEEESYRKLLNVFTKDAKYAEEILPSYGLAHLFNSSSEHPNIQLGSTPKEFLLKVFDDEHRYTFVNHIRTLGIDHPLIIEILNAAQKEYNEYINNINKIFGSDEWQKIVQE
jgi:hypothetical protein